MRLMHLSFAIMAIAISAYAETLFIIGNSLSQHGPAPSLGWHENQGMAASHIGLDYAHQLKSKIEKATGKEYELVIRPPVAEHCLGGLPKEMPKEADIVVLQIGDNYKNQLGREEASKRYTAMLTGLKDAYPQAVIVSVSPWKCAGKEFMLECAKAKGIPFADISPLGQNSSVMDAKGYANWAVNWHPGDRAMELIADTIWETLSTQLLPSRNSATLTGVVPEVKEARLLGRTEFQLMPDMVFHVPEDASEPMRVLLEEIASECKCRFGKSPGIKYDLPGGSRQLTLAKPDAKPEVGIPPEKGYDGYVLKAGENGIAITAAKEGDGLYYGLQTLRQILDGRGAAPASEIHDWAAQKWRIAYLGLADPEFICSKLSRMKINMVIIESYWNGHMNWWYRPLGKNLSQAMEFIKTAKRHNLEVVPLVQGGGWAYGVADRNPHLCEGLWEKDEKTQIKDGTAAFGHKNVIRTKAQPIIVRSADGKTTYEEGKDYEIIEGETRRHFKETNKPWTLKSLPGGRISEGAVVSLDYNYVPFSPHQSPYCPSDPETYELLSEVLEKVIATYHPRFIHIGHDEVIRRNTDRRCQSRHMSREELAAEDLNWWYATLRKLDPTIHIMIWDDMLRKNDENGRLLSMIPEDIIICPWHYHATDAARREIASRVDWFIGERHRPTIGTASGYFPLNSVLWNEELSRHVGEDGNLGMMFSHWGEHIWLWSGLPYAAECMWSGVLLDKERIRTMIDVDETLRNFVMRPTLEASLQLEEFAKSVNHGENKLAELHNAVNDAEMRLQARQLPGFPGTSNPFPEAILSQGRRLAKYYEAMLLARKLPVTKDTMDALRYFALLEELEPRRIAEWNEARARFAADKSLPDTKAVFGREILPAGQ